MRALVIFLVSTFLLGWSVTPSPGGGQPRDWQRAIGPWAWQFPRDHGAHFTFQSEWWYFTGNLEDEHGRPFGYQMTIFRQGLFTEPVQQLSHWALRDAYIGHFTISDLSARKFHCFAKADRGALNESGASCDRMNVHLQDWQIRALPTGANDSYHLLATQPDGSIDFVVTAVQPLILEGDAGLSQKAGGLGQASYYYSYPRLETHGVLKLGKESFSVQGTSWFDHEFSTSSLGSNQVGWDWFCQQFSSGEELMLYCLRRADGSYDTTSRGVWIDARGQKVDLLPGDFILEKVAIWKSAKSGGTYPSKWHLRIPRLQVVLTIVPRMDDQELRLHDLGELSYWEGACEATGQRGQMRLQGTGYTELTGYATNLGGLR